MLGTAIRAKRDIIERIGPATSRIAGLPSISWRCALSISERCSFSAIPGSSNMPSSEPCPAFCMLFSKICSNLGSSVITGSSGSSPTMLCTIARDNATRTAATIAPGS